MANYSTITYNGVTLDVLSITPKKEQKTKKSVIGKSLIQTPIIGMGEQQWVLQINGVVTGTSESDLATKRAEIEALDDVSAFEYVDGIHDGTYYLEPGSLSFNDDSGDAGSHYKYTLTLVQE